MDRKHFYLISGIIYFNRILISGLESYNELYCAQNWKVTIYDMISFQRQREIEHKIII